jgi:hypothetical protein
MRDYKILERAEDLAIKADDLVESGRHGDDKIAARYALASIAYSLCYLANTGINVGGGVQVAIDHDPYAGTNT